QTQYGTVEIPHAWISGIQVYFPNILNESMMEYRYLGDRLTAPEHRGRRCKAVRRPDGKCIRSRMGSMLVEWEDGSQCVVIGRLLRKVASPSTSPGSSG